MPLPQPRLVGDDEDNETLPNELAGDLREDIDFSSGVLLDSASQLMRAAGIEASDSEAARIAARLLEARATEIDAIARALVGRRGKRATASPDILAGELAAIQSGQRGDPMSEANKKRRSEIREKLRGGKA